MQLVLACFFLEKPELGLCLDIVVDHMVGIKWLEEKEYYQCKENSSSTLAFPPHRWIRHFLCKANTHLRCSMKKGCWYIWKGCNKLLKTLYISFFLGMHHCTYEVGKNLYDHWVQLQTNACLETKRTVPDILLLGAGVVGMWRRKKKNPTCNPMATS